MIDRITNERAILLALFALGAHGEDASVSAERIKDKIDHWIELEYLEKDGDDFNVTENGRLFFGLLRSQKRKDRRP